MIAVLDPTTCHSLLPMGVYRGAWPDTATRRNVRPSETKREEGGLDESPTGPRVGSSPATCPTPGIQDFSKRDWVWGPD